MQMEYSNDGDYSKIDDLEADALLFSRPKPLNELEVTYNLYIYNNLVFKMGFNSDMVKNILIYDKDIISNDLQKAVDLWVKTNKGWSHTFVPDNDAKTFRDSSDILNENNEICIICGEGKDQHYGNLNSEFINSIDEPLPDSYAELKESDRILNTQNSTGDEHLPSPHINNLVLIYWAICCCEYEANKIFSLDWQHPFCKNCLNQMFTVNINDGKVMELRWASHDWDQFYSEEDIREILEDEKVLEKYLSFRENFQVNLDANKQWCPMPECRTWVEGTYSHPKVRCLNGHQFWFICQQPWHKGSWRKQMESQLLDYVARNKVARCPRCKIRTEK